jgi:TonB family protein
MAQRSLILSKWPWAVGAVASTAAHVVLFAVAVVPVGPRELSQDGPILPALYLYAPDRQPSIPREIRIPLPEPPGLPDAARDASGSVVPGPTRPHRDESPGLAPLGLARQSIDSIYSAIQVDSEVVRYDWSVAPAYPDRLREEGTEGFVDAEFVVDTTGRVDLATVHILDSSHTEFATSVLDALPGMAFRPAWRGTRKVRQLVGQRFAFRLVRPPVATSSL